LEEVLEMEDATRRLHVFVGRGPRNGRLMQAEAFTDVLQRQRHQRHVAINEEHLLTFDDRIGDAPDRHEPLFDIAQQPACFLQLPSQLRDAVPATTGRSIELAHAPVERRMRS